ncbi:anhydro-N-acetylmuramic acid kinase [Roseivirga misakiensis]|uniref:Anhydro-N-acetylmuramic acid kinase n=1 Tax=Roseivirga misakiensis TaxID=1563681 RepID=A0A1E5T6H0_9BACT|nr:anhydro-N-acetylmuramic acid kinase [Roseivirga misakiensis]OEK06982.1 anhydro-N-acetylmuramic acid kinase [Roseivirga misakiensis]
MLSQKQSSFLIIGVMSGTSLDGLDLVASRFTKNGDSWSYQIELAETIAYPDQLIDDLKEAFKFKKEDLSGLDKELGEFIGNSIRVFSKSLAKEVDFVASHGHTIHHDPANGYTLQIGSGNAIAEMCGYPVINNFRVNDVSLGGQGAPLVPIGDRDLFSEYQYCLNLGGIANITVIRGNDQVLAFDICPFNMALNFLANQLDLKFDEGGVLANEGQVNETLLEQLNQIDFLQKEAPKSLGFEDFSALWLPFLANSSFSTHDLMRTYIEHAAIQISKAIGSNESKERVLVTGGGAFHQTFVNRLKALSKREVVVPSDALINYKEALVFAYLGLLRFLKKPNCLASVTGAKRDNMGGDLYFFP